MSWGQYAVFNNNIRVFIFTVTKVTIREFELQCIVQWNTSRNEKYEIIQWEIFISKVDADDTENMTKMDSENIRCYWTQRANLFTGKIWRKSALKSKCFVF